MQLRPDLQIQTVIKAMAEDVLPALDPDNQLARQAAELTIATLTMLNKQLPLTYRFDCDELDRLIKMAMTLTTHMRDSEKLDEAVSSLQETAKSGQQVLDRARAEPDEILSAIRDLRVSTSNAVREGYQQGATQTVVNIEEIILSVSREQLLRDRSWLLMQGWESEPGKIPDIESLLPPLDPLRE